jgi:hypothetical protein
MLDNAIHAPNLILRLIGAQGTQTLQQLLSLAVGLAKLSSMNPTLAAHLRRGVFPTFLRTLIAAIATNIFADYSFELFVKASSATVHELWFMWTATSVSLLFAVVFASWLKYGTSLKGPWAWLAFGGYLLLQWISQSVGYLLGEAQNGTSTASLLTSVVMVVAVLGLLIDFY